MVFKTPYGSRCSEVRSVNKMFKAARGLFLQLGIPPLSWSPGVCMPPPLLLIPRYWLKTGVRRIIDLTGLLPIKMWILVWSRAITREAATSHHSEYCNQCLEHWPCIIRTPPMHRDQSTHSRKREKLLWIWNDTANSIPWKMRLFSF